MAFTMTVAEVIAADTSGLLSRHDSWERVPLADIATILNGAPFDSALFNTSDGMPLVRIRDVLPGITTTYYTGSYDDLYVIKPSDLLIGMDGDFNCGFWGNQRALLNQRVCKITPDESYYDKRLLAYALPGYLSAINSNTPSVTVKHLSSKTIGEIDLPLPPRAEQIRIVEKLEELFSDLDAGVAELKAAQKKLAQYRQSLLKSAVEGALTAEWRRKNSSTSKCSPIEAPASAQRPPLYERGDRGDLPPEEIPLNPPFKKGDLKPVETGAQLLERILKERRARWEEKQLAKFKEQGKTPPKGWQDKYPQPVQPDTTNLPELPEGWVWASVDQIGEVFLGKMLDKTKHQTGAKLPYLRNISVRWGNIETHDLPEMFFEEDELERYGLAAGDVLVCEGGEPGRAAVCGKEHEELKYQKALHRVRLFSLYVPELLVFYLEYITRSGMLERLFTGSTIKHFTKESFILLPLPLPPIGEQAEIVELLRSAFQGAQEQDTAISHSLAQAAAQRKNILKSAFSGQLVAQDPNDEPASLLLERIRAERQKQAGKPKPGRRLKKQEAAQ